MYIYATEMTSKYYTKLNICGKNVLSIIGSGDQIIDAYFYGAKKVVGFDVNKNALYFTKLKIEAIKKLDYKTFLKFFGTGKVDAEMDFEVYLKFRDKLERDVKDFFDKLYKLYKCDGKKLSLSKIFRQRDGYRDIRFVVGYLKNNKNYNKIKKILSRKKLSLKNVTLKNIVKIKEKFDFINLSNSPNYYVDNLKMVKKVKFFHKEILLVLSKKLEKGGVIFFYNYDKISSIMNQKKSIDDIEKKGSFNVSRFILKKGFNKGRKDKIIILSRD